MKRKHGHKKKKGKPKAETNTVIVNVEDNEILDERGSTDIDENKAESAMEVDTPPLSTDQQQQQNVANVNADSLIKKGTGKSVGRVKVKLKTPKTVESQLTSSEACTQSDTDKSSQQRQGLVSEKMEDSANSLSKMGKKAGSIKIKSSNTLGSDPVLARSESPQEKESSKVHQEYNKQELDIARMIIKKVMEMDAAEPFNVRVDPEASGIHDSCPAGQPRLYGLQPSWQSVSCGNGLQAEALRSLHFGVNLMYPSSRVSREKMVAFS